MSTSRQNQSQCYVDKKTGESGKDHHTYKEPGDCKVNDGHKVVPVDKLTHIDCENKAHKDRSNTYSQNQNQMTDQQNTLYYQEEVTIKDQLPKNTEQQFSKQEEEELFKLHQKQLKPEKEECHSSHQEIQSKPNQEQNKNHDISKNRADFSHHSQEELSKQESSIKNEVGSYDSKNPGVSRHDEPPKLEEMEVQKDNHSIHHNSEITIEHQVDDCKCKAQPLKTYMINKQTSLKHCDKMNKDSQEPSKDPTNKGPEDSELNDDSKEVREETQIDSEKEAQTDHRDTYNQNENQTTDQHNTLHYQEEITTKEPLPNTTQEQLTKHKEEECNKLHQKQLKPQKEEFHSSQQEKALITNPNQPKEQQDKQSKYDSTEGAMKHQAHNPKFEAETLNTHFMKQQSLLECCNGPNNASQETKGTMSSSGVKGQKKNVDPCAPPQPQCHNPCEPEPLCQEPVQQVCEPEPVCEPQCPPPQEICTQSTQQQANKNVKK